MAHEVIFEAKHMHKAFGPTIALKDVDIKICRGEIRGLIGENGSGKSTIMSIAAGMQPATSGEMFYKGEAWHPKSMVDSQHQGISMILQEANTIPGVTVAQNLFAGREKEFSVCGIINMSKMYKEAAALLEKFGITHIHARDRIDSLTFEDRKLTEIVRCVDDNTQILVVDETTTALSRNGRDILYAVMKKMKEEGKSVIFISHDLDEIMEASVIIAIAGMEGALASVLGGLADCPVIAVPTSVGYGASFGGLSSLLTMINSCANGISVVNIDNGYGAGYIATQINRLAVGEKR